MACTPVADGAAVVTALRPGEAVETGPEVGVGALWRGTNPGTEAPGNIALGPRAKDVSAVAEAEGTAWWLVEAAAGPARWRMVGVGALVAGASPAGTRFSSSSSSRTRSVRRTLACGDNEQVDAARLLCTLCAP